MSSRVKILDFPTRLVECRKRSKSTQKQIADTAHISLRVYQYYESGERDATSKVLIALADYFGVSLDYLVGRSDNPEVNR
jgi:transcriptional regulator with XRE-family HTH domain